MSCIPHRNYITNVLLHIEFSTEIISNKLKNKSRIDLKNKQHNITKKQNNRRKLLLFCFKNDKTTIKEISSKYCLQLLFRIGIKRFFISYTYILFYAKLRLTI